MLLSMLNGSSIRSELGFVASCHVPPLDRNAVTPVCSRLAAMRPSRFS